MPQHQKPMDRKKKKARRTKQLAQWRAKQEAEQLPTTSPESSKK